MDAAALLELLLLLLLVLRLSVPTVLVVVAVVAAFLEVLEPVVLEELDEISADELTGVVESWPERSVESGGRSPTVLAIVVRGVEATSVVVVVEVAVVEVEVFGTKGLLVVSMSFRILSLSDSGGVVRPGAFMIFLL